MTVYRYKVINTALAKQLGGLGGELNRAAALGYRAIFAVGHLIIMEATRLDEDSLRRENEVRTGASRSRREGHDGS